MDIHAKIEEYASLLMCIDDIAVLVNMNVDELKNEISNKSSQISIAYRRGKAKTTLEIHRQEINLAKLASPAAVENTARFLEEMNLSED